MNKVNPEILIINGSPRKNKNCVSIINNIIDLYIIFITNNFKSYSFIIMIIKLR